MNPGQPYSNVGIFYPHDSITKRIVVITAKPPGTANGSRNPVLGGGLNYLEESVKKIECIHGLKSVEPYEVSRGALMTITRRI